MHKSIVVFLLSAALSACAVGPNYHRPTTHVEKEFPTGGGAQGAAQESPASNDVYSHAQTQTEFWKQFDDPVLNTMVGDALTANYDLRIALGRLVQARALRNESLFDLAPTVTASGGYTRQRVPGVENPFGGPYTTKLYNAGFDAAWELDFFGGVRRGIQARNAQ
ncbi:MAG: TolC family protein, partial [Steroidobacteraceae bacterium]